MVVEERRKPSFPEGFTLVRMHFAATNQLSNTTRSDGHGPARASIVLGNEGFGPWSKKAGVSSLARVVIYGRALG